ncbi:MAG: hypothetical protein A3K67_02880 [Euryarchaeota archaeon RBG_16_62_10]|nr:MAG: hypothetical protein A3K67_02880 [Euryarchaeota archaeon RBG_16_62_10]
MAGAGGAGGARPPRPDIGNQLVLLAVFMIAILIMFNPSYRQGLGNIVGVPLTPLVGFDGDLPILTLLFTGLLMSFFSITVRHLFIDWVDQARNARITSAFQKELREARSSNNTYKLKKLTEIQPQMMAQSLKSSQTQMKLMPVTMIVVIPIFAWLANFIYIDVASTAFSVPWEANADLERANVLPNWIILYSLLTLPFGQVLTRSLKYLSFGKKLRELDEKAYAPSEDLEDDGEEGAAG